MFFVGTPNHFAWFFPNQPKTTKATDLVLKRLAFPRTRSPAISREIEVSEISKFWPRYHGNLHLFQDQHETPQSGGLVQMFFSPGWRFRFYVSSLGALGLARAWCSAGGENRAKRTRMELSHHKKLSRPVRLSRKLRHIQWATGPLLPRVASHDSTRIALRLRPPEEIWSIETGPLGVNVCALNKAFFPKGGRPLGEYSTLRFPDFFFLPSQIRSICSWDSCMRDHQFRLQSMNAMIPGCFVLRDEWAGKLNFMQLAPPKKGTCLFSLKLERVIFSMGFGWDKDWNFTVSVGKTWHLRQVYGGCLPGFLLSSVKLIFEESAHMFLSGSAATVMPLLLRFRTRTNSALPLQRDDVFAPVKKNCLGDMSPFCRGGMLHLQTNYSLEQPSEPESQETQNHKLNWIYDICMQTCIVVHKIMTILEQQMW